MNKLAILVYCYKCHKPVFIKSNSENHKGIIDEMRGRLKHDHCH